MLTLAVLLLPIIGSGILFALKGNVSKYLAFIIAISELVLTAIIWYNFKANSGIQFEFGKELYFSPIKSTLHFGMDGLALLMLLLTNTLTPIIIYS